MKPWRRCGVAVLVSCFVSGLWLLDRYSRDGVVEPDIAAGHGGSSYSHHSHHSTRVSIEKEPLKFGALVGGHDGRYIVLSTSGQVHTNGQIVDQSARSHIGVENQRKFSANPYYKMQAGRLKVVANKVYAGKYIKIKFFPGALLDGVTLSSLELEVAGLTGATRVDSHVHPSEILFKATGQKKRCGWSYWWFYGCYSDEGSDVEIDIVYGGRLTIDDFVFGEIDAKMDVRVTLSDSSDGHHHYY